MLILCHLFILVAWVPQRNVLSFDFRCMRTLNRRRIHALQTSARNQERESCYKVLDEYDMIIIGAGASGLFASGAATGLGCKTLLIEKTGNIGGDCTNSACVPSKALRSAAQERNGKMKISARKHTTQTIMAVRSRESSQSMVERNPKLQVALVKNDCKFNSSHELILNVEEFYAHNTSSTQFSSESELCLAKGKKILIATGASPVIPEILLSSATNCGVPILTYQSLLKPRHATLENLRHVDLLDQSNNSTSQRVLLAGGGATACELGQSLARLGHDVHLVAPSILPQESISIQRAAIRMLIDEGVQIHLGQRVETLTQDGSSGAPCAILSDGSTVAPGIEALLVCVGRRPNLTSLNLEAAGVMYSEDEGVLVKNNLQSMSTKHIFACGDCASLVCAKPRLRTSTLAAWTGYHAVRNMIVPRILTLGSKTMPSIVPRVIYTDPELVEVGLTVAECIQRYGHDGFDELRASEEGTDRADMDKRIRSTVSFVELRCRSFDGRILGFTACGPTASELANEMCVAIQNELSVLDISRALHSYPSHGYLLHRVALALAFSSIWGNLEACGPVGGFAAGIGRFTTASWLRARNFLRRKSRKRKHDWEAIGASKIFFDVDEQATEGRLRLDSYLESRKPTRTTAEKNVVFTEGNVFLASNINNDFGDWLRQGDTACEE